MVNLDGAEIARRHKPEYPTIEQQLRAHRSCDTLGLSEAVTLAFEEQVGMGMAFRSSASIIRSA